MRDQAMRDEVKMVLFTFSPQTSDARRGDAGVEQSSHRGVSAISRKRGRALQNVVGDRDGADPQSQGSSGKNGRTARGGGVKIWRREAEGCDGRQILWRGRGLLQWQLTYQFCIISTFSSGHVVVQSIISNIKNTVRTRPSS